MHCRPAWLPSEMVLWAKQPLRGERATAQLRGGASGFVHQRSEMQPPQHHFWAEKVLAPSPISAPSAVADTVLDGGALDLLQLHLHLLGVLPQVHPLQGQREGRRVTTAQPNTPTAPSPQSSSWDAPSSGLPAPAHLPGWLGCELKENSTREVQGHRSPQPPPPT